MRKEESARSAAMSTPTHFLYRIDMWTVDGEKVIEHLAGVEDFKVAMATYKAACDRWPGTAITLRQGARVIEAPVRPRQETLVYPLTLSDSREALEPPSRVPRP
jgi:hypothetical protein